MKLRYKFAIGVLILMATGLAVLALVLGYNAPCKPAPELTDDGRLMKAIVGRCYGSPDVLALESVEKPEPASNEVLVKVRAASVNPLDWHYLRGAPYIMRLSSGIGSPKRNRYGVDFAGTVESIGEDVTLFEPGDAVFGSASGAFADYVTVREDRALTAKPDNMSFEQVASVPIAAITALQALRDKGQLKSGQKVLINGASGGVGTFAVQIARALGAEVTGVCSTRNVEMVRSIGADHVFDYTREDYTDSGQHYDLIIDNVGNHSPLTNRKVLTSRGTYVSVGGGKGNWLGPLIGPIKTMLLSPLVEQKFTVLLAQLNKKDLVTLAELMRTGKITPVIDRRYSLNEVPAAISYSEQGHARGKIIVNLP
jgi:NADPH:quinone reductase-like Zn-dependent oxidoreductase